MKFIGKSDLLLILKNLGGIMIGIGIVMILPIFVAIIYKEHSNILNFILPGMFSIILGLLFRNFFNSDETLQLKHAMIVSALAWLWGCLIGSFVMMLCLQIPFIDAFFENMSGWTTTGLTIFQNVEILPKSILFLRSLEQWVGGLGIVILVIGFLIRSGKSASRLYKSEARNERIRPSIVNTVKTIWVIYIILTLIGIILYGIAGMPLFDSINHSMTSLATGGMSIKNASIGFYDSIYIKIITIFLMLIGSISFLIHYKLFTGSFKDVFKNRAVQGILLSVFSFALLNSYLTHISFVDSLFYMSSAITSTGFSIVNTPTFQSWPQITFALLIILMVIGAGEGSTAGAIKINKIIRVLKGVYWEILKTSLPETAIVSNSKLLGTKNTTEEIIEASIYVIIYLIFLVVGVLILTCYNNNLMYSLFEIASAQGNVGLSIGVTSASLGIIPKTLLIFHMWIGRLEILPIILLIKAIYDYLNLSRKQILHKNDFN